MPAEPPPEVRAMQEQAARDAQLMQFVRERGRRLLAMRPDQHYTRVLKALGQPDYRQVRRGSTVMDSEEYWYYILPNGQTAQLCFEGTMMRQLNTY